MQKSRTSIFCWFFLSFYKMCPFLPDKKKSAKKMKFSIPMFFLAEKKIRKMRNWFPKFFSRKNTNKTEKLATVQVSFSGHLQHLHSLSHKMVGYLDKIECHPTFICLGCKHRHRFGECVTPSCIACASEKIACEPCLLCLFTLSFKTDL